MKFINMITFNSFVCAAAGNTEMKYRSTDKEVGIVYFIAQGIHFLGKISDIFYSGLLLTYSVPKY